jgi:hypothetical protein
MTAALTEHLRALQKIGICGGALDQRVKMLGHEAVRNYFDTVRLASTQKFCSDNVDRCAVDERLGAVERAHCDEDTVWSNVEGRVELNGSAVWDTTPPSNLEAESARLKGSRSNDESSARRKGSRSSDNRPLAERGRAPATNRPLAGRARAPTTNRVRSPEGLALQRRIVRSPERLALQRQSSARRKGVALQQRIVRSPERLVLQRQSSALLKGLAL